VDGHVLGVLAPEGARGTILLGAARDVELDAPAAEGRLTRLALDGVQQHLEADLADEEAIELLVFLHHGLPRTQVSQLHVHSILVALHPLKHERVHLNILLSLRRVHPLRNILKYLLISLALGLGGGLNRLFELLSLGQLVVSRDEEGPPLSKEGCRALLG